MIAFSLQMMRSFYATGSAPDAMKSLPLPTADFSAVRFTVFAKREYS